MVSEHLKSVMEWLTDRSEMIEVEDSVPLSHPSLSQCNYKTLGRSCTEPISYLVELHYCWCDDHPGLDVDKCPSGKMDPAEIGVCVNHAARMRESDWTAVVGMRSA